jgi:hypothetical protein
MDITLVLLAGDSTEQGIPILPAIITASATVLGVILAQAVSIMTRRREEAVRHRDQLAEALGAGLGYLSDLEAELSRAEKSGSSYWQLDGWKQAVANWPTIRRQLLTSAMGYPDKKVRAAISTRVGQLTQLVQQQGSPAPELIDQLEKLQRDLVTMASV